MKKSISALLLAIVGLFTTQAHAIDVTCNVGTTEGMLKTAYVRTQSQGYEYFLTGYFYSMMVSVDTANNVRGQWAAGGYKNKGFAHIKMWISRTPVKGDTRRVLGSGGLTSSNDKTCQSSYTQILW